MKKLLLAFAAVVSSYVASAQYFTPGNLVVYRYGDGVANLPTDQITVPTFLDEYSLTGEKVKTLPMPVENGEENSRAVGGGMLIDSEGLISLSPNGQYLTIIGHSVPPNTTPYSTSTQRVIGLITSDGVVNTKSVVKANVFNPRHAITNNGANLWFVGSGNGFRFKPVGSIAANDSVLLDSPWQYSSVYIYNNQLYYVSPYSEEKPRIGKIGEGLSIKGPQTITPLPGYPNTGAPDQIVMLDTDTSTPEPDLLYVTESSTGTLAKWVYNGTTWEAKGTVNVAGVTDKMRGITGAITAGNVVLYSTTETAVLRFTDENAIGTSLSSTQNAPVILVQAPAKTEFKGIAFTPGTAQPVAFTDYSSSQFAARIQARTNLISELKTNKTFQRYPGVEETNITYTSNNGVPIAMFFLKVDLDNPNLTLEAAMPNDQTTYALQTVRNMILHKNAAVTDRVVVAGSNADYFSWTGEPDGAVHKGGQVLKELPDGKFFFGIKNDGTAIVGDKRIYDASASVLREALGGRFFLMRHGEIMTDHLKDNSVEPRSTMGIFTPTKVVFMWVDGRRTGHSSGISLADMAKIYKALGVTDAINIDGGGSTTFLIRKEDGTYETRNRPSDNSERAVANGWVVTAKNEVLSSAGDVVSSAKAGAFSVLPNPVQNRIGLFLPSEASSANLKLQLLSSSGQVLSTFTGTLASINGLLNQEVINLSAGIYSVKITGAKATYHTRFVKQ
ncbi:MAG: phosphodiester glycosidase family protein [Rufibacter sp.]